jgi:hypothetical protein
MVEYALGQADLCFPLPGAVALLTSLTTVRISTEEQTMKQPDHISHPDHTAVPRCPEEATLFLLMERFIERGYAIVAFTPEELGEADPDAVASHMIEHGWQMIDVENAPKTEERADDYNPDSYVFNPLTAPAKDNYKFVPPRSLTIVTPTTECETELEEQAWQDLEQRLARRNQDA